MGVESHAAGRELIHMRSLHDLVPVSPRDARVVLVGHDPPDIRRPFRRSNGKEIVRSERQACGGQGAFFDEFAAGKRSCRSRHLFQVLDLFSGWARLKQRGRLPF